jgi:hypothetical protein
VLYKHYLIYSSEQPSGGATSFTGEEIGPERPVKLPKDTQRQDFEPSTVQ